MRADGPRCVVTLHRERPSSNTERLFCMACHKPTGRTRVIIWIGPLVFGAMHQECFWKG